MKVIITGASGFIGKHTARAAAAAGHQVIGLTRRLEGLPDINGVTWHQGSIDDTSMLRNNNFDALIHLAAHGVDPANATWEDCFKVNVTDSINFWKAAYEAGCRRFVMCGSCFEYGLSGEHYDFIPVTAPLLPTGPYHASKAAASVAAYAFGISYNVRVYIPRPFHVYGDGEAAQRFWPSLRAAAISGNDFEMTSGQQIRDFTPVAIVAEKLFNALTRSDLLPMKPMIENIGTGQPKCLADFARAEWQRYGATGKLDIGKIPLRPNEVMRYVPMVASA